MLTRLQNLIGSTHANELKFRRFPHIRKSPENLRGALAREQEDNLGIFAAPATTTPLPSNFGEPLEGFERDPQIRPPHSILLLGGGVFASLGFIRTLVHLIMFFDLHVHVLATTVDLARSTLYLWMYFVDVVVLVHLATV